MAKGAGPLAIVIPSGQNVCQQAISLSASVVSGAWSQHSGGVNFRLAPSAARASHPKAEKKASTASLKLYNPASFQYLKEDITVISNTILTYNRQNLTSR